MTKKWEICWTLHLQERLCSNPAGAHHFNVFPYQWMHEMIGSLLGILRENVQRGENSIDDDENVISTSLEELHYLFMFWPPARFPS